MSEPLFLTPAELLDLTGYRRPVRQRDWLIRQGIKCVTAKNGKVVVARIWVTEKLDRPGDRPGPKWDALRA